MCKSEDITGIVYSALSKVLSDVEMKVWIEPLNIRKCGDDYFVVGKSLFDIKIVETKYVDFIKAVIEKKYNKINSIDISVEKNIDTDKELKEQYQKDIINKIKNMQL